MKGRYIECKNCGMVFFREESYIKRNKKGFFCSKPCWYEYMRNHKKKACYQYQGECIGKCDYCGKEIRITEGDRKQHKNHFCSHECAGKYHTKYQTGEKSPRFKNAKLHKICPFCGKEFTTYTKEQVCCSRECANKKMYKRVLLVCDCCGNEYNVPESVKKWNDIRNRNYNFCSKECRNLYMRGEHSSKWIKDRNKIKDEDHTERQNSFMKEWRLKVFKRDDYTCQMCGRKSQAGSPVILNAHHIKPFSKNKSLRTDVDNGITLCEECHKKTYKHEYDYEEQFIRIVNERNNGLDAKMRSEHARATRLAKDKSLKIKFE